MRRLGFVFIAVVLCAVANGCMSSTSPVSGPVAHDCASGYTLPNGQCGP
jgi:hypothetical protein